MEDDLKVTREIMIAYLRMKVAEKDWHAVADAAMDLRELEVRIKLESRKDA